MANVGCIRESWPSCDISVNFCMVCVWKIWPSILMCYIRALINRITKGDGILKLRNMAGYLKGPRFYYEYKRITNYRIFIVGV